jgi:hypothetical protein
MSDLLLLSYRREDGDVSTGSVLLRSNGKDTTLVRFVRMGFLDTLKLFAREMVAHPTARGGFHRTDRPGLLPMHLTEEEENLFRTDPAAALQRYTVEPQVVHVGVVKNNQQKVGE